MTGLRLFHFAPLSCISSFTHNAFISSIWVSILQSYPLPILSSHPGLRCFSQRESMKTHYIIAILNNISGGNMLEEQLKKIIPGNLSEFPKLLRNENPYYFYKWDIDIKSKTPILRYWFWDKKMVKKNKKRLFINEFKELIEDSLENGFLTRTAYNKICTRTHNDGSCGFAVIVAILDHIGGIQKKEPGIYGLNNIERYRNILS